MWPLSKMCRAFALLGLGLASRLAGGIEGPARHEESTTILPLQINNRFGLLLVEVEVDGAPATFVIDTGSSRTILNSRLMDSRSTGHRHKLSSEKGSGYVGTAVPVQATLKIGKEIFRSHDFLAMDDLPDISQSLGQNVDGLLGEDVLHEFDVVQFDFKNKSLILSK
jgi:hypothetical protein